jgi:hypothetical protein
VRRREFVTRLGDAGGCMAARGALAAAAVQGIAPEEFANFIELPASPTGPRSFQLPVGGFQLLVGGD